MKVLMIEDNVYKEVEMTRALRDMNITDIKQVDNMEDALALLEKDEFELVLLDMHFRVSKRGEDDDWCGFRVLDWMKEREMHIPVICTSTVRSNLMAYDDCVGQMVYLQDDTAFRLKELINMIPYLYEDRK